MILSKCGVVLVAVVHLVSILDTINCSTMNCTMDNGIFSLVSERVLEPNEIARLWKSCPTMDLYEMLAQPSLEYKRRKCVSFIEEACSCLSLRCPQHIYHHKNASALCSSHLKTNCSKPAVNEEGYFSEEYCLKSLFCLDCERNRSYCHEICEDPLQTKFGADNFCSDEIEYQREESFCAEYISARNCSNLILSDINCTNSPEGCASICGRAQPLGYFARSCPSEVYRFCVQYSMVLLNASHTLTGETFMFYIDVLNTFYRIFPGSVVTDLLDPLLSQLMKSSLLVNDSNLELIVRVFNVLFDDIEDICNISSSLYSNINCQEITEDFVTESAAMLISQLETLGKLISLDITEGRRNSSFTFIGDSLVFSITSVCDIGAVDNQYRIFIEGDQSTKRDLVNDFPLDGFLAEIAISEDVFCKDNDNSAGCSGVVAVSVVNRELFKRPSVNFLHKVDHRNPSDLKGLASELMSIQALGVQDITSKLTKNPVEITLRISNINENSSPNCFFLNPTKRQWSTEGVALKESINGTVKCTSIHLTSFAVIETNFHQFRLDITTVIFLYISCGTSIFFLLATVFCIPFFLKSEMFRKVHFFIHFNLAFVTLLAYIILITEPVVLVSEHVCRFVLLGLHYFFLAAFSWMLCEGIILYLMLVVVFSKLSKSWWFFMIIGYGLPVIPVIVTWSVHHSKFNVCYITSDVQLGFVVPAAASILVNFVILLIVLRKVYKSLKMMNEQGSDPANIRLLVKMLVATLVLAPVLGVTGILVLVYISTSESSPITAATVFIIFNFLQGFLIFFFHVVRSDQIWETSRGKVVKRFLTKCLPKKFVKRTKKTSQLKRSAINTNEDVTNRTLDKHDHDHNPAVVLELMHPNSLVSEDRQMDGRADSDSPRYVTDAAAVPGSTLLESLAPRKDIVRESDVDEQLPENDQLSR